MGLLAEHAPAALLRGNTYVIHWTGPDLDSGETKKLCTSMQNCGGFPETLPESYIPPGLARYFVGSEQQGRSSLAIQVTGSSPTTTQWITHSASTWSAVHYHICCHGYGTGRPALQAQSMKATCSTLVRAVADARFREQNTRRFGRKLDLGPPVRAPTGSSLWRSSFSCGVTRDSTHVKAVLSYSSF